MDKTYLEKRIHEKAESRADDYFEEIHEFLNQHKDLRHLFLEFGHENIALTGYYDDLALFNSQSNLSKYTNWEELKKKLVSKYEKEETDKVLSKLENVNYLLGE